MPPPSPPPPPPDTWSTTLTVSAPDASCDFYFPTRDSLSAYATKHRNALAAQLRIAASDVYVVRITCTARSSGLSKVYNLTREMGGRRSLADVGAPPEVDVVVTVSFITPEAVNAVAGLVDSGSMPDIAAAVKEAAAASFPLGSTLLIESLFDAVSQWLLAGAAMPQHAGCPSSIQLPACLLGLSTQCWYRVIGSLVSCGMSVMHCRWRHRRRPHHPHPHHLRPLHQGPPALLHCPHHRRRCLHLPGHPHRRHHCHLGAPACILSLQRGQSLISEKGIMSGP